MKMWFSVGTLLFMCVVIYSWSTSHALVRRPTPGLTAEERDELLSAHNFFRGAVNPPASNMLQLVWSNTLALIAQEFSSTCNYHESASSRQSSIPPNVGESRVLFQYPSDSVSYRDLVNVWFEQSAYYFYTALSAHCLFQCDQYIQLVWAATQQVGCGLNWCDSGTAAFLVCDYYPRSHSSQRPYMLEMSSQPCSSCPNSTVCNSSSRLCYQLSSEITPSRTLPIRSSLNAELMQKNTLTPIPLSPSPSSRTMNGFVTHDNLMTSLDTNQTFTGDKDTCLPDSISKSLIAASHLVIPTEPGILSHSNGTIMESPDVTGSPIVSTVTHKLMTKTHTLPESSFVTRSVLFTRYPLVTHTQSEIQSQSEGPSFGQGSTLDLLLPTITVVSFPTIFVTQDTRRPLVTRTQREILSEAVRSIVDQTSTLELLTPSSSTIQSFSTITVARNVQTQSSSETIARNYMTTLASTSTHLPSILTPSMSPQIQPLLTTTSNENKNSLFITGQHTNIATSTSAMQVELSVVNSTLTLVQSFPTISVIQNLQTQSSSEIVAHNNTKSLASTNTHPSRVSTPSKSPQIGPSLTTISNENKNSLFETGQRTNITTSTSVMQAITSTLVQQLLTSQVMTTELSETSPTTSNQQSRTCVIVHVHYESNEVECKKGFPLIFTILIGLIPSLVALTLCLILILVMIFKWKRRNRQVKVIYHSRGAHRSLRREMHIYDTHNTTAGDLYDSINLKPLSTTSESIDNINTVTQSVVVIPNLNLDDSDSETQYDECSSRRIVSVDVPVECDVMVAENQDQSTE